MHSVPSVLELICALFKFSKNNQLALGITLIGNFAMTYIIGSKHTGTHKFVVCKQSYVSKLHERLSTTICSVLVCAVKANWLILADMCP